MATLVARNVNYAMVGFGGVNVWRETGVSRREGISTFNLRYKDILESLYLQCDLQECCNKLHYC